MIGPVSKSIYCFLHILLGTVPIVALPEYREPDSITITFEDFSPVGGLTVSITATGNADGITTFSNKNGEGVENAQQYVSDIRILANGHSLDVVHTTSGWTSRHKPNEILTVRYRLPPSGTTNIDGGPAEQFRPLVSEGLFHLIGNAALLLPAGLAESAPVRFTIDASRVASQGQFVSSFGSATRQQDLSVTREQIEAALYIGGAIDLTQYRTEAGQVAVAYSAMSPGFRGEDLRNDARSIIEAERKFFGYGQPWYLVSLHGGRVKNPSIFLGGGTGLTNSFAMFAVDGLDFSNPEQRKQFRWVLAHEYFHQWNGLTLRVAARTPSNADDESVYWFSEGVTEFYTMRLLTQAGLQSPETSLQVLNNKLLAYAANIRHEATAAEVGSLFWTDPDAEQIPYLRGYLVAWFLDIALHHDSKGKRSLDDAIRTLVQRAKNDSEFRINNAFLSTYLPRGLSERDARRFREFAIHGGAMPLEASSFMPCVKGERASISGVAALQFHFVDPAATSCFQH